MKQERKIKSNIGVEKGAKDQVKEIGRALGLNTMSPTVTQVFRRLHDEMTRKKIAEFTLFDIVIEIPAAAKKRARAAARAGKGDQ